MSSATGTLRDRQTAATREQILEAAFEMLHQNPEEFSHEAIARKAGMGARTVYRHFPSRSDLLQALWIRLRETTRTRFPASEQEIVPLARTAMRNFHEHEPLVRATLNSPAGSEVRQRGAAEGRAAFAQSLAGLTAGMSEPEKRRVLAVCLAIYSAPFWQLLRDRGELSGEEAQEAAAWALESVLQAARKKKPIEKEKEKL